ncbi:ABC transporter ATP-binding protein [Paenibacillus sp. YYML68]|uniref:ABC transporter ATP-binding protein n=1 Tax=Paenibacillus sp. YYML68 TaxID=2909250 RepID=UPI0024902A3F|nr:ABC transporter ATP-binding protein [Paenibacillus sp. YYML68]
MITLKQGCKRYGRTVALDHVDVTIGEGKIVGLLGVNGAGKSTLLQCIAGLRRLDSGELLVDGSKPSAEVRARLAYLPDSDTYYSWMKLQDAMDYTRDLFADWDSRKAAHLLDYFRLQPDMRLSAMSKGMRAKAKLLLALSRRARYVLLDEPLSGIDVLARESLIQGLVEDFAEEGQTILMTTHEVKEIEMILDEVLFLRNGRIVLEGSLEQLKLSRKQSLVEMMKELYADEYV